MSYQVLARKWRPRTFKELVGQEHVLKALVNALDNDRLHHAFLFTGTRGVGKTTIARILAKSLNCEKGVSSTPCGECSACTEVNEGRFIDLIEVDAASRTGVDDTRELLENVQYAPTRGRYKVYLIDEVHMFSKSSFNALLKTLEEPPPHVKFLLATTEPKKLPATILSRCLQFNLKRIPLEHIRDHLARVLNEENINFEDTALALISRAADGSMRDALSLLDQAIANGGGQVNADEVRTMLGSIDQNHVIDLLNLLADADAPGLLARINELAQQSPDFAGVLAELISSLHRIALAQIAPDTVDDGLGDRKNIVELAQNMSPEDVQLYYQVGLIGRRDLPIAPDARGGFEMVLLRMLAFRPVDSTHVTPATHSPVATTPAANTHTSNNSQPASSTPTQAVEAISQKPAPVASKGANEWEDEQKDEWENIVAALNLSGMTQQLAIHCTIGKRDEESFQLNMAPAHKHLLGKNREDALAAALSQHLDLTVNLTISVEKQPGTTPADLQQTRDDIRLDQARTTIEDDSAVQAFKDAFDAQVNPETVQPVD
jgi:DNA polymerase-3 subunit gamma/tau